MSEDRWPQILTRLAARETLTADEAAEAMRLVMSGETTPVRSAGS
jgi:anthranilate phosphoribosyltransferase